jgi:serine phosphatase RsbU (regulator of sigma subunit)/streptogramin lyase
MKTSYAFAIVILFAFSCSQNNEQDSKDNKTTDTLAPPQTTLITNLPDSSKPKETILQNTPTPFTITVPKTTGSFYTIKTKKGDKKINLLPPAQKIFDSLQAQGAAFFTTYTTDNGLALDAISSGYKDKTGNLWFGTYGGGVSRYDGKSFVNFTTAQGLANNNVWSITEDKTGNLWFGTDGGGVSRYDGKSFVNFTTAQGLANNTVWSITEDKTGNLWFGTYGGGVSRYDGKSFVNFTTAQGLPDDVVTQVVIDSEQNIVIATNFGVGVVVSFTLKLQAENTKNNIPAQNNLNNEELKNYTPKIEIYNSGTGYPVKDVNAGQNAMYKDSKGIIWIATGADKTGLVRFDYKAVNKNNNPPDVFIQSVKVNNENIVWYNLSSKFKVESSKSDSTATPPNVTEEITTLGKTLSEADRDSMRHKFRDIKFDGITKWYPLPENLILPYKHNSVTFDFAAIEPARPYLIKYQYILEGYDNDWSPVTNKTEATFGNIYEGTYTFKLKAQSPFGVWSEPITYTFKVLPPWWRTWWMYTLYVVIAIGVIVLIVWYNGRRLRARAIELKEDVRKATIEITEQKKVVEEKHKEITDSINYAERIQRSLLASKELLDENLKEHFVFFQPKDVVSGDFYWASKLSNNKFALITADSTGHGVPGAIMSILNIACLNEAIKEGVNMPNEILNHTRTKIIEILKKDGSKEGGKDGMDCSLLSFDFKNNKFTYAAANNPVLIVRGKEILEFAPDKMPVGKHDRDTVLFTQHTIDLQKGDMVYTITDGMPDQFGGPKGKKFMYKQLKELLISIASLPMSEQKEKLSTALNNWKGNLEQVDDVCIIGVRV